jgi:nitrate reductase gamma subunit
MMKAMVRLRLYQFVVASLMVIVVLSPFTQQMNGLDDFVINGNDLESQAAGIFALIGLALLTVRRLLPRFPRSGSIPAASICLVPLSWRPAVGADRLHLLGSEFVLLRI